MAGAASLTACVGLIAPVALEAAERLLAETAGRSWHGGLSIDRRAVWLTACTGVIVPVALETDEHRSDGRTELSCIRHVHRINFPINFDSSLSSTFFYLKHVRMLHAWSSRACCNRIDHPGGASLARDPIFVHACWMKTKRRWRGDQSNLEGGARCWCESDRKKRLGCHGLVKMRLHLDPQSFVEFKRNTSFRVRYTFVRVARTHILSCSVDATFLFQSEPLLYCYSIRAVVCLLF
jgi:hypothetical protein